MNQFNDRNDSPADLPGKNVTMARSVRNWWDDLRGHGRMRGAAWRLLHGREFEEAAVLIEQGMLRFPHSLSFTVLHARYVLLSNQRDQAAGILAARPGLRPRDEFDQFELAETFRMLDRLPEAIRLLEPLTISGPLKLPLLASQRLSSIYHRLEQPDNALRAAVNCIRLGGGQRQVATVQIAATCEPEAIRAAIEDARQVQPINAHHEVNRLKFIAFLATAIGQWELAIDAIESATKQRFVHLYPSDLWDDSQPPLLPGVIIIGAMKSGTTALFRQLLTHPKMVAPLDKELQFFNNPEWPDEFYYAQFPRVISQSPPLVTGEASPGYYVFDIVPRVRRMLPRTKVVFIRRDPVDRAISHLFHNQRQFIREHPANALTIGMENVLELFSMDDDALRGALNDFRTGRKPTNRYLLMGCYDLLIRRWKEAFPHKQFLELEFADFVSSTQPTMNRLFEFVGLGPHPVDASVSFNTGRYKDDSAEFRDIRNQLTDFYARVGNLS